MRTIILFCSLMISLPQSTFKETQLREARVKVAYDEKEEIVKQYFTEKRLDYSGFHMFIRMLKKEMRAEVWIKEKNKTTYALLHTYDFCSTSGVLGPKRKEGDYQIPEGIYHVNHFNPYSSFYLSLGVSYPNASDKILGDKKRPGSAIYIHGNCVTVGCIPITDEKIKELYVLAVEAKQNGQNKIPIHIFPSYLNDAGMSELKKQYVNNATTVAFWENLKTVYQDFETTKKLKTVNINSNGAYTF